MVVDGLCLPGADLCPDGQAWADGICTSLVTCGPGTLLLAGQCVPVDPLSSAQIRESLEPNDLAYPDGIATELILPATEVALVAAGVIHPAADLDGNPATFEADYDSWVFRGAAGQRLRLEATAIGAPAVAFLLSPLEIDGQPGTGQPTRNPLAPLVRAGLPSAGSRNAAREVVLPYDARYELVIADHADLFHRAIRPSLTELAQELTARRGLGVVGDDVSAAALSFGGALDLSSQLLATTGESSASEWNGSDDFTYLLALTSLPATAPIPVTDGAHEADLGQLESLRIDGGSTQRLVELRMRATNPDFVGVYWLRDPGTGNVLFESPPFEALLGYLGLETGGLHWVPEEGLLIQPDFMLANTLDLGLELETHAAEEVAVVPLGEQAPVEEVLGFGESTYRVAELDSEGIVQVRLQSLNPDAAIDLTVWDEALQPLFQERCGRGLSPTGCAAEVLTDRRLVARFGESGGQLGALPDEVPVRWSMRELSLATLEGGPLGAGRTSLEAVIPELGGANDVVYLALDVADFGALLLEVTPGAGLDVAVSLSTGRLLGSVTRAVADDGGPGEAEVLDTFLLPDDLGGDGVLVLVPGRYFVRLEAMGSGTAGVTLTATLTPEPTPSGVPLLTGGNLGTLGDGLVAGSGALRPDFLALGAGIARPLSIESWSFALDVASAVAFEADGGSQGPTAAGALALAVVDANGTVLGVDVPGSASDLYAALDVQLPAGEFRLLVAGLIAGSGDRSEAGGPYLVTARVTGFCVPGGPACDPLSGQVGRCSAGGDSVEAVEAICAMGCGANGACRTVPEDDSPNDTSGTAQDLDGVGASGAALDAGRLSVAGLSALTYTNPIQIDADWYGFTLQGAGIVRIQGREAPTGLARVRYTLYGPDGLSLLGEGVSEAFPQASAVQAALEPGRYLLRVAADDALDLFVDAGELVPYPYRIDIDLDPTVEGDP